MIALHSQEALHRRTRQSSQGSLDVSRRCRPSKARWARCPSSAGRGMYIWCANLGDLAASCNFRASRRAHPLLHQRPPTPGAEAQLILYETLSIAAALADGSLGPSNLHGRRVVSLQSPSCQLQLPCRTTYNRRCMKGTDWELRSDKVSRPRAMQMAMRRKRWLLASAHASQF
ncbi:hypothetical protein BD626DRAFT_491317 [Schizophyllum amplum]|uniref:Uncharacterized protein n=1 Tax=Schizophyllum amplum TaxID=97359 RepID=A0A550CHJ7_9AGAR|nr:hypothetical protein BD626DRAFT_491317 [Auriculariopsis ampla]